MLEPSQNLPSRQVATFCPFKAPVRESIAFGGTLLPLRIFEQRPGMRLVHATFPEGGLPTEVTWPIRSHLQVIFLAQGRLTFRCDSRPAVSASADHWLLVKPANQPIKATVQSGCQLHWLEFDEQAAQGLTGFSDTVTPALLDDASPFLTCGNASGRLLALGQELSQFDGNSTRERLLIESKTLEWLALLLDQPVFSPCRAISPSRNARDEAALTAAARLLETRCHEDHSIAQISRTVHLNEFKLKRGFKERFGTTVFGFLRQKRMERARQLLDEGSPSVIEVANAVGYSNPSHFARAFKEAFGFNPSDLSK